ncbi:TPA: hypothetical protein ACKP36_000930 [Serratia marcescens]
MSTGIGKHEFSTNHQDIYKPDLAVCPYCGNGNCLADFVDVGVGMVQCGPYHCESCGASEVSYLDKRILTEAEKKTGWYEPGSAVSESANTVNGHLVDHCMAMDFYRMGMLDDKSGGDQ